MINIISDTGPILHLDEISFIRVLSLFSKIIISDSIKSELELYNIILPPEISLTINKIKNNTILNLERPFKIHESDKSVLILAQRFEPALILTDDLELRKAAEFLNIRVTGTIGILIKAFKNGMLSFQELDYAIESLFKNSSLFTSTIFQDYIKKLIKNLPR